MRRKWKVYILHEQATPIYRQWTTTTSEEICLMITYGSDFHSFFSAVKTAECTIYVQIHRLISMKTLNFLRASEMISCQFYMKVSTRQQFGKTSNWGSVVNSDWWNKKDAESKTDLKQILAKSIWFYVFTKSQHPADDDYECYFFLRVVCVWVWWDGEEDGTARLIFMLSSIVFLYL